MRMPSETPADGGETVPLGEAPGSSAAGACKALSSPRKPCRGNGASNAAL